MSIKDTSPVLKNIFMDGLADSGLLATCVLRDMDEGMIVLNLKGRIVAYNGSAAHMLDFDSNVANMAYRNIMDHSRKENDAFHQLFLDAIYEKDRTHSGTVDYYSLSNKHSKLKINISFLMDEESKNKIGLSAIFTDVTEKEQLKQYQKRPPLFLLHLLSA